jgi:hypothetical protein
MRAVTESTLGTVLAGLSGVPRAVVSGNFATEWRVLGVLDAAVAEYRLFALNAQAGTPDRAGVILESAFVGPGMRGSSRLRNLPCRLSPVPSLLATALPPDVVVAQTSAPIGGTVSLGIEVNILPAAIAAVRARGGLVVAQLDPYMPYTYGDAVLAEDEIDLAVEVNDLLPSPPPRHITDVHESIGERVAFTRAGRREAAARHRRRARCRTGPTPPPPWPGECGRRCSATASSASSRRVAWTSNGRSRCRSYSAVTNSIAGSTATLGCGCCAPRRLMTLASSPVMVPVNGALQVDLFAQANAARGARGHLLRVWRPDRLRRGRTALAGGRAIIALPSWHPKAECPPWCPGWRAP